MTYLPLHFAETDTATLHALVRAHPLATWVVQHQGELLVNHVPLLLDAERGEHGTLLGHVARANPVWRRWVGKCKASQNRPTADQQGVAAGLRGAGGEAAARMAALMQQRIAP